VSVFDDWQRPEWLARRDDGTWESDHLLARDAALSSTWQHYARQPGAVAHMLTQMSLPPTGYSVAWVRDGAVLEVFESRST
jgi:hypothetical protein